MATYSPGGVVTSQPEEASRLERSDPPSHRDNKIVGARPGAEFLAVSLPPGPGLLGGALTEKERASSGDPKGKQIAKSLQTRQYAQRTAAILGNKISVQLIQFEAGREEVHVVQQRIRQVG